MCKGLKAPDWENKNHARHLPPIHCSHAPTPIVIHKYLRTVVIPTVPYLALDEKQAELQTFQVFKTWEV